MRLLMLIVIFSATILSHANEGWVFEKLKTTGKTVGVFEKIRFGDFCYLKMENLQHSFLCDESIDIQLLKKQRGKTLEIHWELIQYSHPALSPTPVEAKRVLSFRAIE